MNDPRQALRRQAARQAAGVMLVLAASVALVVAAAKRPDDLAAVRIATGELRSEAAEVQWMARHADGLLPPRFEREHAAQLAKAIARTREEIAGLDPEPALRGVPPALQPRERAIADAVASLERSPRRHPAADPEALREDTEALAAAELALKR
jgi:hypothetical protein